MVGAIEVDGILDRVKTVESAKPMAEAVYGFEQVYVATAADGAAAIIAGPEIAVDDSDIFDRK